MLLAACWSGVIAGMYGSIRLIMVESWLVMPGLYLLGINQVFITGIRSRLFVTATESVNGQVILELQSDDYSPLFCYDSMYL